MKACHCAFRPSLRDGVIYRFGSLRRSIANTAGQIFFRLSATAIFRESYSRKSTASFAFNCCFKRSQAALTSSLSVLSEARNVKEIATDLRSRQLFSCRIHKDTERLDLDKEFRIARPDLLFDVAIGHSHWADDGNVTENGRKLRNLVKRRLSPESLERFQSHLAGEHWLGGIHFPSHGRR